MHLNFFEFCRYHCHDFDKITCLFRRYGSDQRYDKVFGTAKIDPSQAECTQLRAHDVIQWWAEK